jgi:hypothetical protein
LSARGPGSPASRQRQEGPASAFISAWAMNVPPTPRPCCGRGEERPVGVEIEQHDHRLQAVDVTTYRAGAVECCRNVAMKIPEENSELAHNHSDRLLPSPALPVAHVGPPATYAPW